jgi:hypothetical protein
MRAPLGQQLVGQSIQFAGDFLYIWPDAAMA